MMRPVNSCGRRHGVAVLVQHFPLHRADTHSDSHLSTYKRTVHAHATTSSTSWHLSFLLPLSLTFRDGSPTARFFQASTTTRSYFHSSYHHS